jgi:RHS repeat-associated protein
VAVRHDFIPFGEEIQQGVGGRTAGLNYGTSDDIKQKFTSKERDVESGLDYFEARYYSSAQGRFTSPDEFKGGGAREARALANSAAQEKQALPYADLANPQSLNKYQYAYENPLRYVDPDGHRDILVIESGPTEGNPVGHTAVAITGYGVFSFGTKTALGSSTSEYVQKEVEKRDVQLYVIKTTPEQDKAAADALLKQDEKGAINVFPDNCATRSNVALDAAGVPRAGPGPDAEGGYAAVSVSIPGSAGQRAQGVTGSQPDGATALAPIPKGSTDLPAQVRQFEPNNPNPGQGLPRPENRAGVHHTSPRSSD